MAPKRAKIIVDCFKQRTPDRDGFEDAGKADYNIVGADSRGSGYGKVPEMQFKINEVKEQ
jgi:hypothetical protein